MSNGGDDTVMTSFYLLKRFGEAFVIVIQLGWPVTLVIRGNKVSSSGGSSLALAGMNSVGGRRPVLSFTDTAVLSGSGESLGRTAIHPAGTEQTSLDFLSQGWARERNDFLDCV